MPELPEVDMIAGVLRRHMVGRQIVGGQVVRQPKNNAYDLTNLVGRRVGEVYRRGKHVMVMLDDGRILDCHNAMTGYWDWEHEPWTFDYVEADRTPGDSDVRVRLTLDDGKVARFHDMRFFGRMAVVAGRPEVGPELMDTPNRDPLSTVITLQEFSSWILSEKRTVKESLMDQSRISGIGNIYASEACHLACIDPSRIGSRVDPRAVPLLLESLRTVILRQIPSINYDLLKAYRRAECDVCDTKLVRTLIAKRATFHCPTCQTL